MIKVKLNPESGKKVLAINGIGSFKEGEEYEVDEKIFNKHLKYYVETVNPLNKDKLIKIPVFIIINDVKKTANSEPEETSDNKKGGTRK